MTDVTENDNWDVEADVTLTPEQQQQFLSDTRSMILKLNELKKLLSAAGTDVILGAEEQDNFSPNLITITPEQQQQFLSDTRNMILKLNELKELLSDVGTSFSITPETPNNLSTPSDMGLMALTPELQQQLLSDTQSMFLKLTELKQLLSDFDFKMNVTLKPEEQSNFSMTSMGSITMTPQQQEEFFSEIQSITLKLKELKQLLSNSGMSVISKPEEQDDFSTTGMGLMTLQPDTASVSLKPHEQLHPDADSDVTSSHEEQGQFLLDTPSVTLKPNERKKTFTDTEMDEILRADQQDDFLTDEDLVTLMPNELAHSDADIDATLRPEHQEQTLSNCLKKSHELVDPDAEIDATLRLNERHQEQLLSDSMNMIPKPHEQFHPDADLDVVLTHEQQGEFISDTLSVTLKTNEIKQIISDTKMYETWRAEQQDDFLTGNGGGLVTLRPHELVLPDTEIDATLRPEQQEQTLSDSLKKLHELADCDAEINATLRLEDQHQEQSLFDCLNGTPKPQLFHPDNEIDATLRLEEEQRQDVTPKAHGLLYPDADMDVILTHEDQGQFLSDPLSVTLKSPNEMKQMFSDTKMDETLRADQQVDFFLTDEDLETLKPHEIIHSGADTDTTLRPDKLEQSLSDSLKKPHEHAPDVEIDAILRLEEQHQEQTISDSLNVTLRPNKLFHSDADLDVTSTHEEQVQFLLSDTLSVTLKPNEMKQTFSDTEMDDTLRDDQQNDFLIDEGLVALRPHEIVHTDAVDATLRPEQQEQSLSATMNMIPHELLLPDTQINMTMTHEQKEQFSPSDYKSTTLRSDQQKEIFPSSNRVRTELQEQCLCDNLSATTFRPYQLKEVLQDSEIEIMTPDQKEQFLSQGEWDQLLCDSETEKEWYDFPTTAKVLMTFSSGKQEEFPSDTTRMALTGPETEELHYLIVHDDIEMNSFCINGDAENQGNMEMGNTIYMSTEGPLETKGPYV